MYISADRDDKRIDIVDLKERAEFLGCTLSNDGLAACEFWTSVILILEVGVDVTHLQQFVGVFILHNERIVDILIAIDIGAHRLDSDVEDKLSISLRVDVITLEAEFGLVPLLEPKVGPDIHGSIQEDVVVSIGLTDAIRREQAALNIAGISLDEHIVW